MNRKLHTVHVLRSQPLQWNLGEARPRDVVFVAPLCIRCLRFFTDTIGFLLLIPITRKIIFSLVIKKKNNKVNSDKTIEAEVIDEKDEL